VIPRNRFKNALYMVWRYEGAGKGSATQAQNLLNRGQEKCLFQVRSYVAANREVRVLLNPAAPVEEIARAARKQRYETVTTRWIASERTCTSLIREIETVPVNLGLASRPEEWPFSSAANK
jgi:hypothetical protein